MHVQNQTSTVETAFEAKYSPDHGVIVVQIKDTFRNLSVKDYSLRIVQLARENGCKNILLDARGKKLGLSTVEIYQLPSILNHYGVDRSFRHAILADPNQQEYVFFETVAFNRSYQVKVFHDQILALNWLGNQKRGFIL